jgi:hypothetical protein
MRYSDLQEELSRRMRQEINDQKTTWEKALAHGPTRKVLRSILDACGVYEPETPADRRAVGLELIRAISEVDPHGYVRLMTEAVNEKVAMEAALAREIEERDDDD